jgi:ribose 5-phosphate isomerase A
MSKSETPVIDAQNQNEKDPLIALGRAVVENHIHSGIVMGLGSGSAVAKFAKALGSAIKNSEISGISIVPSSTQAWLVAQENSLPIHADAAHCPKSLDLAVDGADQISLRTRSMIKGGGGALLREKIILTASSHSYILADSSKVANELSHPVPLEVVPFAIESVEEAISKRLNGVPSLRKLDKGYPFFTESGNLILDCQFARTISDPLESEKTLKSIPGVVEAGLFNCPVDKFYVASKDGSIESY